MKYYSNSLQRIQDAIGAIYDSFTWAATTEGSDYWEGVIEKLNRHKAACESAGACKAEIAELKARIAELEKRC